MHVQQSNPLVCPACHVHVKMICMCVQHPLYSHTPSFHTFYVCVCVFAAFIVVLMHPRDHLTSQWTFSVTLVCFMWCLRLWLFLFHADDAIIDLSSNWGGLGECELSSIVNSRHDFSKRERLGWRTMDHLCVISMTHAPLWNPLLPFSLFLNANWYMLVDFVFMYGCFSQPVCMLMSILSWIVPVSQWVETPACLSCALWRTPHALLLFFFLHHTLYKCFFEPGFS